MFWSDEKVIKKLAEIAGIKKERINFTDTFFSQEDFIPYKYITIDEERTPVLFNCELSQTPIKTIELRTDAKFAELFKNWTDYINEI